MLCFTNPKVQKDKDGKQRKKIPVRPLTETQGDKSWFLMRGYACNSSIMDKVTRAKLPFFEQNHDHRDAFATIAEYAKMKSLYYQQPR